MFYDKLNEILKGIIKKLIKVRPIMKIWVNEKK